VSAWLTQYQALFTWLAIGSIVTFVVSLLSLPWLVALIPEDYFCHERRHPADLKKSHPVVRMTLLIAKNVFGAILLLGGLVMLFVPGQGLLTIAMGLLLLDYPDKFQLEQRLAANPRILNGLNWLRGRAGVAPLRIDRRDYK